MRNSVSILSKTIQATTNQYKFKGSVQVLFPTFTLLIHYSLYRCHDVMKVFLYKCLQQLSEPPINTLSTAINSTWVIRRRVTCQLIKLVYTYYRSLHRLTNDFQVNELLNYVTKE